MNDAPRRSNRLLPMVLLILVVGGVVAIPIVRQFVPNGAPPEPPELSVEELQQLVASKNYANAALENLPNYRTNAEAQDVGGKAIETFEEIAAKLPGEPLGRRNTAIARFLLLRRYELLDDRSGVDAAYQSAQQALEALRTAEGDTPIVRLLDAKISQSAFTSELPIEPHQVVEKYRAAADAWPEDNFVWGEFYDFLKQNEVDPELRAMIPEVLEQARKAQPDNIVLIVDSLEQRVRRKDPDMAATLEQARDLLAPFAPGFAITPDRFEEIISTALDALKSDPPNWDQVQPVRLVLNVVRPQLVFQMDRARIGRHALEFMLHDFSPEFYERAKLPPPQDPESISVKFVAAPDDQQLPESADVADVLLADFDLDMRPDVAVLRDGRLEIYSRAPDSDAWSLLAEADLPPGLNGLVAADLDRDILAAPPADAAPMHAPDADVDLVVYGPGGLRVVENRFDRETGQRSLRVVEENLDALYDLADVNAAAIADLDHDGDLDLAVASESGLSLWSNAEGFRFQDVSSRSLLPPAEFPVSSIVAVDWDHNVLTDLIVAGASSEQLGILDNVRHGRFRWRELDAKFKHPGGIEALAVDDADGSASWDLLAGGKQGLSLLQTFNPEPANVRFSKAAELSADAVTALETWDYDNDGFLDVVAIGEAGLLILRGSAAGGFQPVGDLFETAPDNVQALDVGDVDDDGDLDLLTAGANGVRWFLNEGGNENAWLKVALNAETDFKERNQRSNMHGLGSLLEVKQGNRYQARIVTRQTTHIGLGKHRQPDAVRVLWTNGIPQSELRPDTNVTLRQDQRIQETSCPFVYTWTGERFEFFTDLLWASPLGLQAAEGVLVPYREWEYLKIPGERLVARKGEYVLQITEELWEAAYFDEVKLLAVDHPGDVEIYSNEKVGPAELAEFRIHTVRHRRPLVAARDKHGRDIFPEIEQADGRFVKAFDARITKGLVDEHYLELDLGELQEPKRITLFLTGWISPATSNLNVANSHNPAQAAAQPPSIWVPDENGVWQQTMPYMGFPGGKTKTIAVDLSDAFLTEDYRLRIVTSLELYWDEIFFTVDESPVETKVTALELAGADLHYRGYSRRLRSEDNSPDSYGYDEVTTTPAWPPMSGRFTRFGDVTELIAERDDLLVVMGAGDEMTVRFRVPDTELPPGWKRDFLLHNVGWDKDCNLNTVLGHSSEPLPFRAMTGYPFAPGETYPDTALHREFVRKYQTRRQDQSEFWRELRPDTLSDTRQH